ncbi:glycosyltransferase family 39 protein [Candidatus Woesearchaeota archaeon]|nr:glycosyltransferase family 39 protein [Candidatus Woesearchaeota archaeon]
MRLRGIISEDKLKGCLLLCLVFCLHLTRLSIYFNEYINNNPANIYLGLSVDRPLSTLFFRALFSVDLLNNALAVWLVQLAVILAAVFIYYKAVSAYLNKGIAFLSSLILILSPHVMNLSNLIDYYSLNFFFYTLSTYLFILYLKVPGHQKLYAVAIADAIAFLFDHAFILFLFAQVGYLAMINRDRITRKTLSKAVIPAIVFSAFLITVIILKKDFISDVYIMLITSHPYQQQIESSLYGLFGSNIVFMTFISVFSVLILISGLAGKKKHFTANKLVLYNVLVNLGISLAIISVLYSPLGILHPGTRYFIYTWFWIAVLFAHNLDRLLKHRKIRYCLYAFVVLMVVSYCWESYGFRNLSEKVQGHERLSYIYENFSNDHIILVHDKNPRPTAGWESISRYSFKDKFSLRAWPSKTNVIDSIYSEIDDEWTGHIFLNNLYEYKGFIVISSSDAAGSSEDISKYITMLAGILEKLGYPYIIVPEDQELIDQGLVSGLEKDEINRAPIFYSSQS